MSLLDLASYDSYYKGISYYQNGCVVSYEKIGDGLYRGVVRGTKKYTIILNINHPRKSVCNCPYADGKQIICKHKVALYLAIFPEEIKRIEEEQKQYELEREEAERKFESAMKKHEKEVRKYVNSLSKDELRKILINKLIDNSYDIVRSDFFDEEDEP